MNVDWLSKLPAPARRGLYFGLQSLLGSRVYSAWREFQGWERLGPEQLRDAVEKRLGRVLNAAVAQSEHYRSLGLKQRAGENAGEFLRRFPVLTRGEVRERFTELVIDPLRHEILSAASVSKRRYDWLVVKTGGTTGQPTSVVHDASARDWGRATRLHAAKMCGMALGTRYFRLWGSEPDLHGQQASLQLRVLNGLLGAVGINAFRAKEAELRQQHAAMMAQPDIQHLMTYVDAAAGLALFIKDQNLLRRPFKTIMACAGSVTPEYRKILEEVFEAEVFDKYGSRECCDMACECQRHSGLHVYSPNVFLEIVDEQGAPCPPGETGHLLVTLLNNSSFPMIRYKIGDLAEWAEPGRCPCGSAWPRLKSLQGRADDMLTTEDGTLLSSVFVRHFVGVSLNRQIIREWQLEQVEAKRFVFRYIPIKAEGLSANLNEITSSFRLALGKNVTIELQQVNEVPPAPTGKVRWIINGEHRKRRAPDVSVEGEPIRQ